MKSCGETEPSNSPCQRMSVSQTIEMHEMPSIHLLLIKKNVFRRNKRVGSALMPSLGIREQKIIIKTGKIWYRLLKLLYASIAGCCDSIRRHTQTLLSIRDGTVSCSIQSCRAQLDTNARTTHTHTHKKSHEGKHAAPRQLWRLNVKL